jgi:glycosyltransferase involved in cell wall biosynthesis
VGAIALLSNAAATGLLGILYWIIAARTYRSASVGHGSALIAASGLCIGLGQTLTMGVLVRFLPVSGQHSPQLIIRTYGLSVALASTLAAGSLAVLSSHGGILDLPGWQTLLYLLAAPLGAVFSLQDFALIGLGRPTWLPVENSLYGLAKILLLVCLQGHGEGFAIFVSWVAPQVFLVPGMNYLIFKRWLRLPVRPVDGTHVAVATRRKIVRYATGDAGASLFAHFWPYGLPLVVTATMGAVSNAHFYTAFLFATSLDLALAGVAALLTAEGARQPEQAQALVVSTFFRLLVLSVAAATAMGILTPYAMAFFGRTYADSVNLLRLLLIASVFKSQLGVYFAACRIEHKTHIVAVYQATMAVGILTGTALVASYQRSLTGIVVVVIATHAIAFLVAVPALRRYVRRSPSPVRPAPLQASCVAASDTAAARPGTPVRVLYLTPGNPVNPPQKALAGIWHHVAVYNVTFRILALLPTSGQVEEPASLARPVVVHAHYRRPCRFLASIRAELREHRPDLIHSAGLGADVLARCISLATGIPAISSVLPDRPAAFPPSGSPRRRFATLCAALLDRCTAWGTTRFHAPSASAASTASRRLAIPETDIHVISADAESGRALSSSQLRCLVRANLGMHVSERAILCVTGRGSQNAADVTLEAFTLVRRTMPGTRLLVVRPGQLDAREAGHGETAEDTGVIRVDGLESVPDFLFAVDVLCLPEPWDDLRATVTSAVALQLPIVIVRPPPDTDAPHLPGAQLGSNGSPEGLSRALISILRHRPPLRALPVAGVRRVEQQFSTERVASAMAALYFEVCGRGSIPASTPRGLRRLPPAVDPASTT